MKRYEYRTFLLRPMDDGYRHNYQEYTTDKLNVLGSQGWEVVSELSSSYDGIMLLLKKEILDERIESNIVPHSLSGFHKSSDNDETE